MDAVACTLWTSDRTTYIHATTTVFSVMQTRLLILNYIHRKDAVIDPEEIIF